MVLASAYGSGQCGTVTGVSATGSQAGRLGGRLIALTHDRLVRSIGWFCLAEAGARVSKIVTTVILARVLGPVDLGVAAIAITVFELIRVIANNGIGQMVIRARPEDLDATCNTAWRANLLVCGLSALLHVVAGAVVAQISGRPELFGMIACLGGVYILMIPSMMPVYLLLRRSAIKSVALASMAHVMADNVLTFVLALNGFGAWSIVLPKLVTVPVWIIGLRMSQTWTPNRAAGFIPLMAMVRFALPVMASELLGAMRVNLDKIIVWSILGIEMLGIYYFAFNAGIGFSLSLTSALSNSLYPELARLAEQPRRMLRRFDRALVRSAAPIAIVIGIQAAMAFVYVPIVFGARWESSVVLVALLCVSAVTKPFFDAASQLLRANGRPLDEVMGSTAYTAITLAVFTLALPHGLFSGIVALAGCTLLLQSGFAVWARWRVAASIDHARSQRSPSVWLGRWTTT